MKTAIVLKGGLAKGFGAIGIIRYLQELGYKPDVLVGASSGAQIAAMYAVGKSWQEMLDIVGNYRLKQTSSLKSLILQGHLFPDELIRELFLKNNDFTELDFSQTKQPVMFISTDRSAKRQQLLFSGNLIDALLASNAFPGVISRQHLYLSDYRDGDLIDQFLVTDLKRRGYDRVIGVSRTTEASKPRSYKPLDLLTKFFVDDKWVKDKHKLDYSFEYDASDVGYAEFDKVPELAEEVYQQAAQCNLQSFLLT